MGERLGGSAFPNHPSVRVLTRPSSARLLPVAADLVECLPTGKRPAVAFTDDGGTRRDEQAEHDGGVEE